MWLWNKWSTGRFTGKNSWCRLQTLHGCKFSNMGNIKVKVHVSQKISHSKNTLLWKDFQRRVKWWFSFCEIFFCSRDIQVFLLCKFCHWWCHPGCAQACHSNWRKQIFQINITGLKIPTGGRQTSWLFTSMTEELKVLGSTEKQLQLSGQSGTWTHDLRITSLAP